MIKSFALTCLLAGTTMAAFSTQPVRRILVSDSNGAVSSVSLDSLGLARPGNGDTYCPYRASQPADTRSFHTVSDDGLGRLGVSALGTLPSIGKQLIPVVLVEFADVSFTSRASDKTRVHAGVCAITS